MKKIKSKNYFKLWPNPNTKFGILTLQFCIYSNLGRVKKPVLCSFLMLIMLSAQSQTFVRSELPTTLSIPWEMTYGPDNYLWITESGGQVSRVNPSNGNKTIVYTAPDYFGGDPLEDLATCFQPPIGAGTLGLALHPDFINSSTSFIYFVYSYNSGTSGSPATKFKIKRLTWDSNSSTVIADLDIITMIETGYDHLGGRLMCIEQNDTPYLFLTVGDHGLSETNSPTCYADQSTNPNTLAQDPTTQNGKIHRFNMDGSIPSDNPIPGNSFYTRGHRNPQGLMYNPNLEIIYSIEHGDRTDDEINTLYKGMNYGWKYIRGYHDDNNFTGEANFIANYTLHPLIANDSLVEAFYSWCDVPEDTSSVYLNWCTVAPSDGIYYGNTAIPQWHNSLLVVTLKNGADADMEVYQFKLLYNGELAPSTTENPNPKKFFGEDQALNGRLRDIAVSPDGKTIYLINNFGAPTNKITVYTLDTSSVEPFEPLLIECVEVYPNPTTDAIALIGIESLTGITSIKITVLNGEVISSLNESNTYIDVSKLAAGVYVVHITHDGGICAVKFVKS